MANHMIPMTDSSRAVKITTPVKHVCHEWSWDFQESQDFKVITRLELNSCTTCHKYHHTCHTEETSGTICFRNSENSGFLENLWELFPIDLTLTKSYHSLDARHECEICVEDVP